MVKEERLWPLFGQTRSNLWSMQHMLQNGNAKHELTREKQTRTNMPYIEIPTCIMLYVLYWMKYVLPPCRENKDIPALWLNSHGLPLHGDVLSKLVVDCSNEFNNDLCVAPTDYRRMTITEFFAQNDSNFINENVDTLGALCNVSKAIMLDNYNRHPLTEKTRRLSQHIINPMLTSNTSDLQEGQSILSELVDIEVDGIINETVMRVPRLTLDDDEWKEQYRNMKNNNNN